jgi:NTE family protein
MTTALDEDDEDHGASRYFATRDRQGIALCLSGGGFRAALYHLGALRCLNDLGVLSRVTSIASVSGGSVLAAFAATRLPWPLGGPLPAAEWEERLAGPFREFVARDRRTWAVLLGCLPRISAVDVFEHELDTVFGGCGLGALPDPASPGVPRFTLCATDLTYGDLWRFERDVVGDEQVGFAPPWSEVDSLARAVAISACLAPIFPPYVLDLSAVALKRPRRTAVGGGGNGGDEAGRGRGPGAVALNDGGTYDNLGLEAVWRTHQVLLVSDGGAPKQPAGRTRFPQLLGRTWHSSDLNDQMGRLARRRWFIANLMEGVFDGAYWGIAHAPRDHDDRFRYGYSREFVRTRVASMRTDLDGFSTPEQCVLENHGYTAAFAAVARWGRRALRLQGARELDVAPARVPHPEAAWWDEAALAHALRASHRRLRLGAWAADAATRGCRRVAAALRGARSGGAPSRDGAPPDPSDPGPDSTQS